ncbi:MAG: phosphoenolpyruvate--protein phosphotransferase [Polyangiaceae bacterium]|jgi:phosphotransferase system enzyme I (PtsI)|nr:phosphoenolpyruvate--protein phosphotransferase [Polyangiaceae bacterium]
MSDVAGSVGQEPVSLRGICGSPGIGIGPAVVIGRPVTSFKRRHVLDRDVDVEVERFRKAVIDAEAHLRQVIARAGRATAELDILEAYVLMISDDALATEVERKIRVDRKSAEWSVVSSIREFAVQFEGAEDLYLRERSHDFHFVGELLLRVLRGGPGATPLIKLEQPAVVVAHELSPADAASLAREPVLGIVTECGTRTGHTAIMARAFEIPTVVGVAEALAHTRPGDVVVVDGIRGVFTVRPSGEQLLVARERDRVLQELRLHLRDDLDRPAAMGCGTPIVIRANIEFLDEVPAALARGAQGIGLFRTEYLYINRAVPPSEDEQYETYRALAATLAPQCATLRTFDIGGDKFASSLELPPELNPALGLRAVRLGLSCPELLRQQLRAMVRASAAGTLRIMLPMIATLHELRAVRELLGEAIAEVDARGLPRAARIPLGIMLEIPSALLLATEFAREADFFSIGTNDLIQYTLAADRTNRSLAYLASPFDPSIVRLVRMAVGAATLNNRPLSVCGEMASDPLGALLLVGLGVRELSMEAAALLEVKEALRRVPLAEAELVAQEALAMDGAEAVEQCMARAFAPRLYDLLG